jgi:hypothetical protein
MQLRPRIIACLVIICTWSASANDFVAPRGVPSKDEVALGTDPAHSQATTRKVGETIFTFTEHRRTTYSIPADTIVLEERAGSTWGFLEGKRRVEATAGTTAPYRTWGNGYAMLCVGAAGSHAATPKETSGCFVDTNSDGRFDASVFPTYEKRHPVDRPASFKHFKEATTIVSPPRLARGLTVELAYQGVSRGEAKVLYREFKDDLARPAFSQDLAFELDADGSTVIVFRDIRLKVSKATREDITYTVESPALSGAFSDGTKP